MLFVMRRRCCGGTGGVPHIAVTELALGNGAKPDTVGFTHNGMNEGNDMYRTRRRRGKK
jgi:hypothetical protein